MSDHYTALTVILEGAPKDENVDQLIAAISQFRGVIKVVPKIATGDTYLAETKAKWQIRAKLFKILEED